MELKEVRDELISLPSVDSQVNKLEERWNRLHRITESHLNSKLDPLQKKIINHKIQEGHRHLLTLKQNKMLQEMLRQYSHYLVELKLTLFKGDNAKAKVLTNMLAKDETLNLRQAISGVIHFQDSVKSFSRQFKEVSEILEDHLPLEEKIMLLDPTHQYSFKYLLMHSEKQKAIVRDLGRHFLNISKQISVKNARR